MYESFFGLQKRPFSAAPQPEFYFPAAAAENARQTLARCIDRAEGPALLSGPAGTGKTLLCQVLADQLREEFRVAMLSSGRLCTRRALLQAILFELGLPYRDMEEGELRLSLIDHLSPSAACPNGMLLIADEAHALPLRLLEEIRMITNLVRDGKPRVRLLLCGGPALEERFASPKLESFNQRIAARCYTESMLREETFGFVRAQLATVGGEAERIFTDDALKAVHDATDGIPRLVNQVCDHALVLAAVGGGRQIDGAGVAEAWADLQQLPAPSATAGAEKLGSGESHVIEFGALDDDESQPAAVPFPSLDDDPPTEVDPQEKVGEAFDFPSADPTMQLDEIQREVERVTAEFDTAPAATLPLDQFQPAAAEPELEVVLETAANPFDEPFDEEEVVIDRYASFGPLDLEQRPQVTGDEGRAIAELLAASDDGKQTPSHSDNAAPEPPADCRKRTPCRSENTTPDRAAAVQPPAETTTDDNGGRAPQEALTSDVAALLNDAHEPAAPVTPLEPAAPAGDEPELAIVANVEPVEQINATPTEPAAVEPAAETPPEPEVIAADDDRDLILVERDTSPHTNRGVRRREYRQLFAKLRMG